MNSTSSEPAKVEKRKGRRRRVLSLLMLLLVITITVVLLLNRDQLVRLGNYGYLGAFLVCLVSNTTVFFTIPGIVVLFALGTTFNPVLVALAGAAGGTIGEITGYLLGYSGREIIRDDKTFARVEKWIRKWGALAIFLFAAVPLPVVDIAGVVAGALRFALWKFLLIVWFGKSLKYISLVLAGVWGWESLLRFFG